jgi:hypothetical protein
MKKILKGAGAILIIFFLVTSSFVVLGQTANENILLTHIECSGSANGAKGPVVWDNGMNYDGLLAAQYDSSTPYDAYPADDFQIAGGAIVSGVHWIGGYYNPDQHAEYDWCIMFYRDDLGPDVGYAGPFYYSWMEITTTILELGKYEMSVELPVNVVFTSDKYWISIWAIGPMPPQSGWGYHFDPVKLHQAVFKSDYFGIPYWIDFSVLTGLDPADMAFQLTEGSSPEPDLGCDGRLYWEDVTPGNTVIGEILVYNEGDAGSTLNWQVASWPTWGTWTFNPPSGSISYSYTPIQVIVVAPPDRTETFLGTVKIINSDDPTDFCEIPVTLHTPRNRGIFFNIFEQIINQFPQLKTIFGL